MKKKVLVTYSVKYIKEIELEVTEFQNKWLDKDVIHQEDGELFEQVYNFNQDVLFDLPIPHLVQTGDNEFEIVEYVDSSFDIESFEI